jgi:purine-nucleoside phosphorylase
MNELNRADAEEAAVFLSANMSVHPKMAVLTGTGLGDITAGLQLDTTIDYGRIPHFPLSTVQSHHGRLVAGAMGGVPVMVLQGRFHLYEGYTAGQVVFPIRVLQALGVKIVVLTNASGGLNPSFNAGDIMVIADHINLTGANPLIGPNDDQWGPRFPDMTSAYDQGLRQLVRENAKLTDAGIRSGVYAGLKGPSLETPAEMHFLRTVGADAVGFSTVMEAIAAVHAGMRVLGLSVITNMNLPDNPQPASVEAIIAVAQAAAPRLEKIIHRVAGTVT